jgi:hypothetical protein
MNVLVPIRCRGVTSWPPEKVLASQEWLYSTELVVLSRQYRSYFVHLHIIIYYSVIYYTGRHHIACFNATEGLHPPYRAALSQQYSVASFATMQVLNCLRSPGLHCSCCNVVRFFHDLEACNSVKPGTVLCVCVCFRILSPVQCQVYWHLRGL